MSEHPLPIVEEAPRIFQERFAYSANKFQVEELLDEIEPRYRQVAFARMRPVILIGRDMDHVLGDSLKKRQLVQFGGDVPLTYIWDEDVASAFVLALKKRLGVRSTSVPMRQ